MRPLTKISLFGIRLATFVLIVYWVLLFTGTHLPTLPKISPRISDKLLHFSAFFGLAMLLCWVIPTRSSPWRKFIAVAAVAVVYGAFDEITQSFVRGRTTDIRDFAADALGAFSAISLYAGGRWFVLRWLPDSVLVRAPAAGPAVETAVTCQTSKPETCKDVTLAVSVASASDGEKDGKLRVIQTNLPRAMSADHDSINVA